MAGEGLSRTEKSLQRNGFWRLQDGPGEGAAILASPHRETSPGSRWGIIESICNIHTRGKTYVHVCL